MLSSKTSKGILYLASSQNPMRFLKKRCLAASLLAQQKQKKYVYLETKQNPKRHFPQNMMPTITVVDLPKAHLATSPQQINSFTFHQDLFKRLDAALWCDVATKKWLFFRDEYFKALQSVPHFLHHKKHVGNCYNHKIMISTVKVHCTNQNHHKRIGIPRIHSS